MKTRLMVLLACLSALLAFGTRSRAQGVSGDSKNKPLRDAPSSMLSWVELLGATGTPQHQVLSINKLWSWHLAEGGGNQSPTGRNGLVFPKFTAATVYKDNLVIGGKVYVNGFPGSGGIVPSSQSVRINGGSYSEGMDAGWVEGLGETALPVDPSRPEVRIYRIRRNYASMTDGELTQEAQIFFEHASPQDVTPSEKQAILDQYALDWAEWPVNHASPYSGGAPYIERNGAAGYQAPPPFAASFTADSLISGNYDEPGLAGSDPDRPADQVIYTAYNGLRPSRTVSFAGSLPMGLEVQKTVWAYDRNDEMGNVYYVRSRLVNRGGVDVGGGQPGSFHLDSLFVCQWADMDIGSFGDDLVACDSLRNLAYAYNGNAVDGEYAKFSLPPPAAGYVVLAGALVDAPGDSGVFDFRRVYNRKNQPMSSFAFTAAGSPYADPPGGNYDNGAGQWWKLLRGYTPVGSFSTPDYPYPHPPGYPITKFPLSGDPVSGSGFLDGLGVTYSFLPADRRILSSTGPFRLAPGESAEIHVAFVAAIGADRLSSVSLLKGVADLCRAEFEGLFVGDPTSDVRRSEDPIPHFALEGNYPNPFNPSTTIVFTTARRVHVTLTVYDLLGQEVARLLDGDTERGTHAVTWDASGHAGGVYVCRLQAGDFVASGRLLLLK